jgi:hypothetical protein
MDRLRVDWSLYNAFSTFSTTWTELESLGLWISCKQLVSTFSRRQMDSLRVGIKIVDVVVQYFLVPFPTARWIDGVSARSLM